MAIWNPTTFLTRFMGAGSSCLTWPFVSNFDQDWQDSAYYWQQREGTIYYNHMWNNACAIRLLIDKCDSLQAQIDGSAGGVDMQAILDAMWASFGGQTMTFILYIDAMRGSISEKSVYEPYLSSYMRHFL